MVSSGPTERPAASDDRTTSGRLGASQDRASSGGSRRRAGRVRATTSALSKPSWAEAAIVDLGESGRKGVPGEAVPAGLTTLCG